MIKKNFYIAVHPGEILQEQLLALGVSQTQLASHLGVHHSKINEICKGRRGISADMAYQLSQAIGASPAFWMNAQSNWELSKKDPNEYQKISRLEGEKAA